MAAALIVLVLASGCAARAATMPQQTASAALPFPLGIASGDGAFGFMETPKGGIRAIDLRDGSILWTTDAARRPLIADGGTLVAVAPIPEQRNAFRVVSIAIATGRTTNRSEPVILPEWAAAFDAPGLELQLRAVPTSDAVRVDWCGRSWYGGGAAPPEELERASRHEAQGSARVDRATGRVTPITTEAGTRVSCEPAAAPAVTQALPPGAFAAGVVGGRVYYLMPSSDRSESGATVATLTAADASSGAIIWQRPVDVRPRPRKLPLEIHPPEF